jgi:hypothetical protein
MLARTKLLLPLAAVLALVPASGAQAAKATFTGVFEAHRSVKWDAPRIVTMTNCRGENYNLANGGEEVEIKTKPFKVKVETFGKSVRWDFQKSKSPTGEDEYGFVGHGPHKRWYHEERGNTGGWCGGAEVAPKPETDCGTKLPTYLVSFNATNGIMNWNANSAPWMANERLHFYKCTLVPPEGMYNGSFPRVDGPYKQADLFNRRKGTIKIGATKAYGPSITPRSTTVNRTTSGTVTWELVLTRTKK